jgi:hypothetical protein
LYSASYETKGSGLENDGQIRPCFWEGVGEEGPEWPRYQGA